MNYFRFSSLLFLFLSTSLYAGNLADIKHVIVIGVDGMSPDGIQNASTPIMDSLIKTGAYSLEAEAVVPTNSSPNWASMLMGAPPEKHKIRSNRWKLKHARRHSFCGNKKGEIFPTIFKVLRDYNPEAVIAAFHDWNDFGRLIEPNVCTVKKNCDGEEGTTADAIEYILEHKPLLTFIHLDLVDHAGHRYGHGTEKYYASVEEADSLVGAIVNAAKDAGILKNTVFLIISDHGGKGRGHGGNSLAERQIPWIINGPTVASGKKISTFINIYDTAPTLAHLLQIKPPDCWTGKVITEAFQQ